MDKGMIKTKIRQAEQGHAWPGGFPVFALMKDGSCICSKCIKENRGRIFIETLYGTKYHNEWQIESAEVNWEDSSLFCDNCSDRIESAYSE
jgi:hypothetical protein